MTAPTTQEVEALAAVERRNCTNGGAQYCYGCYTMERDDEWGDWVRYEDYEKGITALRALAADNERLRERLDDYRDDYIAVMNENCAGDEKHCSCVPVLRTELAALRAVADDRDAARAEIERLRAWQKDAIDRIKVYINICDHQRVTGEYMAANVCVYCALDRALIDAALGRDEK